MPGQLALQLRAQRFQTVPRCPESHEKPDDNDILQVRKKPRRGRKDKRRQGAQKAVKHNIVSKFPAP